MLNLVYSATNANNLIDRGHTLHRQIQTALHQRHELFLSHGAFFKGGVILITQWSIESNRKP